MGWQTTDTRVFEQIANQHRQWDLIRILAEGDSWFAYPRQFLLAGRPANIIDHLAAEENLLILNTAASGDEILEMIAGEQKFSLLKRLYHMEFDMVLLSGGGNDLVGRYDFGFLLHPFKDGMDWPDCIHRQHLDIKLRQVELAFRELIERILDIHPKMPIVTHTYDFAVPSPVGFELFDIFPVGRSWMQPYFEARGITDTNFQKKIIRNVLVRFKNTLLRIARDYEDNFTVVNTQGLLKDYQWLNEIHPTSEGFGLIARKMYEEAINP